MEPRHYGPLSLKWMQERGGVDGTQEPGILLGAFTTTLSSTYDYLHPTDEGNGSQEG